MSELEQSGTDVASEGSSPSTESNDSTSGAESQKQSASTETKQEQYVPYDRFKELVEQKNQFAKQFEETQKQMQELRSKLEQSSQPKSVSPSQKMIQTLKERGVEPEFVSWLEQQEASKSELEQLKEWRKQAEQQNYYTNVRSVVEKLKADNKVEDHFHTSYLAQIPNGTPPEEVAKRYKALHDATAKYLDQYKRSALSEYTSSKKTDSKVPAPQKGAAPKGSSSKPQYPKDAEAARAQLKADISAALRSGKNI